MPGADSYPEGTTALATDSEQRSLVKICSLIAAGGGGGGGGAGVTQIATGNSDPAGAPAAGIVLFERMDVTRELKWNGSAWVVNFSEV